MERNKDKETEIVARWLKSIGSNMPNIPSKDLQEKFNAFVLAPFCLLDISYEMLHDTLKNANLKGDSLILAKRIKKQFSREIFNRRGSIYKGLTDEQVYYLSEYQDAQKEAVEQDIEKIYWEAFGSCEEVEFNTKNQYCNIFLASIIACVADAQLTNDLHIDFCALKKIVSDFQYLLAESLKHFGMKSGIAFKDRHVIELINIMGKKIAAA